MGMWRDAQNIEDVVDGAPDPDDCGACFGYGHVSADNRPSLDKRDRKCLACSGTGKQPKALAAWGSRGHTPGPWSHGATGGGLEDRNVYADAEVGFEVATVYDCGISGRAEANARLIAAAPDLLSELRWAADFVCDNLCAERQLGDRGSHGEECGQIRAAIAKAEGK